MESADASEKVYESERGHRTGVLYGTSEGVNRLNIGPTGRTATTCWASELLPARGPLRVLGRGARRFPTTVRRSSRPDVVCAKLAGRARDSPQSWLASSRRSRGVRVAAPRLSNFGRARSLRRRTHTPDSASIPDPACPSRREAAF